MNLVAIDSLLSVVLVIVLIFLPKINQKYKRHIDFLVGGELNMFVLVVLTSILINYGLPLSTFFTVLLVLEAHNRVNLVEHFRAYFGLKRVCESSFHV
jgi:type III secretory pathway component EscV